MWALRKVNIENYKSIERITLELKDGVTVIVGPNGSGKSNLLEAILFGLGEKVTNLRAATLKDIAAPNRAENRTQVDLYFERPTVKNGTNIVISSYIKDGTRHYLVNKAKVTKKVFDAVVNRDLGFAIEKTCFSIRQSSAQQIIQASPEKLLSVLRDVAGSQLLEEAQRQAQAQLSAGSVALEDVSKQIQTFDSELEAQGRQLAIATELPQTQLLLKRSQEEFSRVATCLALCSRYDATKRVHDALQSLQAVRQEKVDMELAAERLKSDMETEQIGRGAAAQERQHLEGLKNKLSGEQNRRASLLATTSETETILSELRAEKSSLLNAMQTARVERELLERNELARMRREKAMHELQVNQHPPTDSDDSDDVLAHRKSLHQVKAECALLESSCMRCTSSLSALQARRIALQASESSYLSAMGELRLELSKCMEGVDSNTTEEGGGDRSGVCDTQELLIRKISLEKQVEGLVTSCQAARRAFSAMEEDRGVFGRDDWGGVCDILQPVQRQDMVHYHGALEVVVSRSLGVRVCGSLATGLHILQESESRGNVEGFVEGGVRVWPVQDMATPSSRSPLWTQFVDAVLRRCREGEDGQGSHAEVLDPATLFNVIDRTGNLMDDDVACGKVLYKACGNWLIVDSDATAMQVISALTSPPFSGTGVVTGAVTISGNVHQVGSLRVQRAPSSSSSSSVARLEQYHKHLRALEKAQISLSNCVQSLEARRESEKRKAANGRLLEAQMRLQHVREELEVIINGAPNEATDTSPPLRSTVSGREDSSSTASEIGAADHAEARRGVRWLEMNREALQRELAEKTLRKEALQKLLGSLDSRKREAPDDSGHDVISKFRIAEGARIGGHLSLLERRVEGLREREDTHREALEDCCLRIEAAEEHLKELRESTAKIDRVIMGMEEEITTTAPFLGEDSSLCDPSKATDADSRREGFEAMCVSLDTLSEKQTLLDREVAAAVSRWQEEGFSDESVANNDQQQVAKLTKRKRLRKMSPRELHHSDRCGEDNGSLHSLLDQVSQGKDSSDGNGVLERSVAAVQRALQSVSEEFSMVFSGGQKGDVNEARALIEESPLGSLCALLDTEKHEVEEKIRELRHAMSELKKEAVRLGLATGGNEQEEGSDAVQLLQADGDEVSDSKRNLLEQNTAVRDHLLHRYKQIEQGLRVLASLASRAENQIRQLHWDTYEALRARFKSHFREMVALPGGTSLSVDLLPASASLQSEEEKEEGRGAEDIAGERSGRALDGGLVFQLKRSTGVSALLPSSSSSPAAETGKAHDVGGAVTGERREARELSGGQQVLLALAFLFACALHNKKSPLYLLDEVDAALDEANQRAIANAIGKVFSSSANDRVNMPRNRQQQHQVLCVSHNEGFQMHAQNTIWVRKKHENTVLD